MGSSDPFTYKLLFYTTFTLFCAKNSTDCVHVCMRAEICACVPASTATSQQFESQDRFPRNFCVAYYRFILLSPYFVREIALIVCVHVCACGNMRLHACINSHLPATSQQFETPDRFPRNFCVAIVCTHQKALCYLVFISHRG